MNYTKRLFYIIFIAISLTAKLSSLANSDKTFELSKLHAAVLGITQGVTEFLPVSSTGHMVLVNEYFFKNDSSTNQNNTAESALKDYMVCIQLGTIISLLLFYKKELFKVFGDSIKFSGNGISLGINLIVAFIPTGAVGFLFGDIIQNTLYNRPMVILAILAGGFLILFVGKAKKRANNVETTNSVFEISTLAAVGVGLFQIIALWPGFSRSLSTIVGGLCVGMPMIQAVNFSFLLGLLTTGVATLYKFIKSGQEMMSILDATSVSIGILAAFVFGLITVHCFIKYLKNNGLVIFGFYRIILGFILLALTI